MNNREVDKLLTLIRGGDNDAFAELYVKTKRGVYSFLYTYYRKPEDTEDAMQTVYLKVKRNIESYRPGTNGRAWLLEIAKNIALNDLKKNKELELLTDEADETVSEAEGITDLVKNILDEQSAHIVILHAMWGYKHREIASMMGLPTGTVLSKYKRAVDKLKTEMRKGGILV